VPARGRADSWPRRRAQYETWLAADGSFALAARRDAALIGYILVAVDAADETYATGERVARIETMLVAEGERENGVGGLLFDAAMAELGTQGVDDIFVAYMHGNDGARRFYERLGFSPFVHLLYAKRPGTPPVPRPDPEER
jgi:GNAT superfamily N-acetyltransferase